MMDLSTTKPQTCLFWPLGEIPLSSFIAYYVTVIDMRLIYREL